MGASQPSETEKCFFDSLVLVRSLDVSKSLMRDPRSDQLFAVVEHTFPSEEQMHKFSDQLRKKKQTSHQYYLGALKQLVVSSSNLCSKQHKVVQIFPWEEYSLMDEILSRQLERRQFSEREVWSILCSCVLAMSYFTKNELTHLTLSPKDIVLTSEGQVKILASELSEYHFDYSYKHGFYYAPETLKAISCHSLYSPNNKAAVFTLGMSLLAAMRNEDLAYLYREKEGGISVNIAELKTLIDKVQNEEMKSVLQKMLKAAPYERISFTELEEMLYEILENSEQQSNQPETEQIERLEESIFRLRSKQEGEDALTLPTHHLSQCDTLAADEEDMPSSLPFCSLVETQIMDEEDNSKTGPGEKYKHNQKQDGARKVKENEKEKEKENVKDRTTNENSRLSDNNNNNNNHKSNLRAPLIDKSNSIQISESLKIVDDCSNSRNCKNDFLLAKTSRQEGPTYVTEQYSRGRYEGYKENGMRHGFGTFYYEEGGKYSGEWYKNKMQGRGALYYTNGELAYEGEWQQDQLHGYGVLYNETPIYCTEAANWRELDKVGCSWVKYEGNFARDMKHGEGTLFLANGEYFRGEFKEDMPWGKGIFRALNNQLVKGSWREGQFEGYEH